MKMSKGERPRCGPPRERDRDSGDGCLRGAWKSSQAHLEHALRNSVVPKTRVPLRVRVRHRVGTYELGAHLFAGVTGENSPHYTNQPRIRKTARVLAKYFFLGTCRQRSTRKQLQLLGRFFPLRALRNAPQTIEQSQDPGPGRGGGIPVASGNLPARDAIEFEADKEFAFLGREPSQLLTDIEEATENDFGIERLLSRRIRNFFYRIATRLLRRSSSRFANGPTKRLPAQLARNRKRQVRSSRPHFR